MHNLVVLVKPVHRRKLVSDHKQRMARVVRIYSMAVVRLLHNLGRTLARVNRKFKATSGNCCSLKSNSCKMKLFVLFRFGISYHGAAQSASGTKEQVTQYRDQNKSLFQSIGNFANSNR